MNSVPLTIGESGDGLLLFDADCPFCRRSVRWLLQHERSDSGLRIVGLGSAISRRLGEHFQIDFASTDSIWYIAEGELSRNSDAAWRLATRLKAPWQHLEALRRVPRAWRESGYRFIGERRHRLSFLGAGRLEEHERWLDRLTPEFCRRCGLSPSLAEEQDR